MRKFKNIEKLKEKKFKRRFGVRKKTYFLLVKIVNNALKKKKSIGRKTKLNPQQQVLVTLEYFREYRTYFHIAQDWNVSESTICRTVHKIEKILISSGDLSLPGKKQLINPEKIKAVLIDVTESPIQRPKKGQKQYYSGKKKQHTLKSQLVINQINLEIICCVNSSGKCHDFKMFKKSKLPLHEKIRCLVDKGYQGIKKIHKRSDIPFKKSKKKKLTEEEKKYNRKINKERITIEHVNRKLKIFKILSETYRNRRKRFGLRFNLIAGIYNIENKSNLAS